MGQFVINGGQILNGQVNISGAKNSVLPILAATVLNSGITTLKNVPMLSDTFVAIDILKYLGANVCVFENELVIDTKNINKTLIPNELVKKMRSSIVFLGSLLARFNKAYVFYPGGCNLGKRPIDFHINSFKKLGMNVKNRKELISVDSNNFKPNSLDLPFPSVGATQNIILSNIFCKGKTILKGAAKEPEIVDLQNFLNKMGANVSGAGTDEIIIKGVKKLSNSLEYSIMPDRIEAGTFLCAAAITGGNLKLNCLNSNHLTSLTEVLKSIGCSIEEKLNSITISRKEPIKPIKLIETSPYPGFPTDLQPQLMSLLTLAKGRSIIKENVFEKRNKHIFELNKMGSNITGSETTFIIDGVDSLKGETVFAKDLRGGAALIIAGLAARGQTIVKGDAYVKRGYENIEKKLSLVGADIKYFKD